MVVSSFEKIEKERLEDLRFPDSEVLSDPEKINQRKHDLEKALALGNLEHSKIKIFFEDDNSCKYVETTVWGITDSRVILKQGMVIPIYRIHSLEL